MSTLRQQSLYEAFDDAREPVNLLLRLRLRLGESRDGAREHLVDLGLGGGLHRHDAVEFGD